MTNRYIKSGATLFIGKVMLRMENMKAELNEHRYYLERNVERRTEYLLKRIAVLESCNMTLCNKLALADEELAALKPQPEYDGDTSQGRAVKICIVNNPAQKLIGSNAQDKWDEHATAA
jgi:prefoldin subunit 5